MPLQHFHNLLRTVDHQLAGATPESVPLILSTVSTDLFGILLWRREQLKHFPNLYALLPPLPPPDIQQRFAGATGETLLPMACSFMNYFDKMTALHLGKPINQAQVIDYGCGWGRLTRFLIKYAPVPNIRALDPDASVLTQMAGTVLAGRTRAISRHPGSGVGEPSADVAFLFSILTHTPPAVTAELSAWLTQVLSPGALLMFTIRPKAYWRHHSNYMTGYSVEMMMQQHDQQGFAYMGHGATNMEYGDSSYTDEYILSLFPQFSVVDRTFVITDPLQLYYTLKRK